MRDNRPLRRDHSQPTRRRVRERFGLEPYPELPGRIAAIVNGVLLVVELALFAALVMGVGR